MSSLKLFFYFLKALHHNFFQLWSDDTSSLKALHTVNAWSSEQGLILAQKKVDSKSNEITAVPLLLITEVT